MKKSWTLSLVSELIPRRNLDQSAQTIQEIADDHGFSWNKGKLEVAKLLKAGKIEECSKMIDKRCCRAYRPLR